jgi:glycosyltransferase involved in cell wall biosynthesis
MPIVIGTDFGFVNGGAGAVALGSAKGLARRGHDVRLFTAIGPIDADLLATPGLRHECLEQLNVWEDPNVAGAALRGLWNTSAHQRLRRLLDDCHPAQTVFHLHSWTKALSPSVIHAALSRDVAVVVTLHDYFSVCPTGTLFNHPQERICELRPMSRACVTCNCDSRSYAHKLWRVARHAIQTAAGLSHQVHDLIVVSEASARVFRPLLPSQTRLHHVPNFVEVRYGPPTRVEDNEAIVYAGRLSPEKGAALLAASAAPLDVPLVFIGDGPERDAVKRLCPRAEITGWLDSGAVHQRLQGCARALAFPSIWYETQGLVVAEAAALGIPTIVPDTCAARDWVEHGISGLWFRGGDERDLREKSALLVGDPSLARRLGGAAHARFWAAPPTLDSHLATLERVYESALAVRRQAVNHAKPTATVEEVR